MIKKQYILGVLLLSGLIFVNNQVPSPNETEPWYNTEKFPPPNIPADNPQSKEGIELGRFLFYEKMLSGNKKQSCGSCHLQKLAFTDGEKLAIGSKGDTISRNTMSLTNLAWGKDFFWDGRVKSLEDLVLHPVSDSLEMDMDTVLLVELLREHDHYPNLFERAFPGEGIHTATISKAIAQFLRSISAEAQDFSILDYPFKNPEDTSEKVLSYDVFNLEPDTITLFQADTVVYESFKSRSFQSPLMNEASFKGMYFRMGIMCTPCHTSESFGGELMANNLIDENQKQLFKVPSLINSPLTAPYMRDGRFANLDEVFAHYNEHISSLHTANGHLNIPPIPNLFTEYDRENFESFFEIFTDSSVLNNKAFSDPFEAKSFSWEKK